MADIRCPMCGKSNPAERETCRYCSARLKPLVAPPNPPAKPGPEEAPDWLSSFRDGNAPGGQEDLGQASSFDGESEAPDWLSRLGGDSTQPSAESSDLPDWFTSPDSAAQSTPAQESTPAPGFSQGDEPALPDWFSTSKTESGLLDWLSAADETPQAENPASEPAAPDWMSSIQDSSSPQPSWLSDSSEPATPEDQPTQGFDFTALNTPAFGSEPAEDSGEDESSNWLSDDQDNAEWLSQPESKAAPETPPAAEAGSSRLPDWLSSLGTGETDDSQAEAGDSDWLSRVRARRDADQERDEQAGPEGENAAAPAAGMPDWLSELNAAIPQGQDAQGAAPVSPFLGSSDSGDDLSFDWLAGEVSQANQIGEEKNALEASLTSPAGAPTGAPAGVPAGDDDTPDWLKSLNNDFNQSSNRFAPGATAVLPDLPEDNPPASAAFSTEGDAPDWLADLSETAGTPAQPGSVPAFVIDEEPTGAPDEPVQEETFSALPDWLSGVSAEDSSPIIQSEGEPESAPDLEPASLPTWLEAMRPVEGVTLEPFKDTSDSRVENAGPLAGLRGALPAEIDIKGVQTPPPYTIKLPVSADLDSRLSVLKELLEAETRSQPAPKPAALSANLVVRALVFLFLLAAVIWSLYVGPLASTQFTPLSSSQAAQDFQIQVLSLSSGSRVLLALDYEPGYAAEINNALQPVLGHLQNQGVFVTALSTSVTGALLAEQAQANLEASSGLTGPKITNLGYLPGGPAGLAAFALNPAGILPVDIQADQGWAEAGMNPAAGLDNFNLVLVATDNAKTVNMWAEQLGPLLAQKRIALLMISSAQAEAVVQPYYATNPRLVSGYLGSLGDAQYFAAATGETLPQPGGLPTGSLQNSYAAAVLATVLLVIFGNLFNLGLSLFSTQKQAKPGTPRGEVKA